MRRTVSGASQACGMLTEESLPGITSPSTGSRFLNAGGMNSNSEDQQQKEGSFLDMLIGKKYTCSMCTSYLQRTKQTTSRLPSSSNHKPSTSLVKAGVARQLVDSISLGIAPCACTILSKVLSSPPPHLPQNYAFHPYTNPNLLRPLHAPSLTPVGAI